MIRRPPRSTRVRSSAASDVYKRQGSDYALHAVDYVIKNVSVLKESPQVLLLNVQWNVAAGNVKLFISQQTINDYYREQGMAALQSARAALDAAALPYQYHISVGTCLLYTSPSPRD